MRSLTFTLLLAVPLMLVGCGSNATTPPASSPDSGGPVAPIPVEVTAVKFDELNAAIDKWKGRPVLLDFWATWCIPCVEGFPHFIATHKKYRDQGLATISVSMDPRGSKDKYSPEDVLNFLKKQDATFPNYVLLQNSEAEPKLEKRFHKEGGIPFTVLLDKSGQVIWTSEMWAEEKWTDQEKHERLDKVIEEQLRK